MRNAETDALGLRLQEAFVKSGLPVEDFVAHIKATRDHVHVRDSDVFVPNSGEIAHFYFAEGRWGCKF